jgi:hypothetical protein
MTARTVAPATVAPRTGVPTTGVPAPVADPNSSDTDGSPEALAGAVDAAARAVAALEPQARGTAQELRAAIEAVHRDALVTIVRRLRADGAGRDLLFELVDDPMVRLVFSLHGIIRTPRGETDPGPATTPAAPAGDGAGGGGCGSGCGSGGSRQGTAFVPLSAVHVRGSAGAPPAIPGGA